jgi:hypothetical protein
VAITDEQLREAREQIYLDVLAGVEFVMIGEEQVRLADAKSRLAALDALEARQINAVPRRAIGYTTRLISPGGWS